MDPVCWYTSSKEVEPVAWSTPGSTSLSYLITILHIFSQDRMASQKKNEKDTRHRRSQDWKVFFSSVETCSDDDPLSDRGGVSNRRLVFVRVRGWGPDTKQMFVWTHFYVNLKQELFFRRRPFCFFLRRRFSEPYLRRSRKSCERERKRKRESKNWGQGPFL